MAWFTSMFTLKSLSRPWHEESCNGLGVDVILVLGGLHRLGLDEEGALEALLAGVVARHSQHGGHVFLLTLHVGVEQRHVAFAAAPEDVGGAAQLDGGVDGVLDLHDGAGHNVEVGVGGGAVHVALVAEHVGGAPQQLDARLGLLLLEIGHDFLQVLLVGLHVGRFGHEVHVVEAVVFDAELLHDFEAGVSLVFGGLQGIGGGVPGEGLRAGAELVGALGAGVLPHNMANFIHSLIFLPITTRLAS